MQRKRLHAHDGATAAEPPRRLSRRWRIALWCVAASLVALLAGTGAGAYWLIDQVRALDPTTPGIEALRRAEAARPSVMLAADGHLLASFARTYQERVPLERIAPHVTRALLATEDHRFHEHRGIDPVRTLSAAWHTLNGRTQGGSTITQQLARNLFPEEIGRERTFDRKLKELLTALRIERLYSKEQILEHYLNTAPFLYNVVGIEMAARTYFGKNGADLDVLESATLVGMLKGAHHFNPVAYPERTLQRRNVVLSQLVKHGWLDAAAYQRLRGAPLGVRFNRPSEPPGMAPHFTAHARERVLEWAGPRGIDLATAGLVIHTTLDPTLQAAAEQAVRRQSDALQAVADVEWSTARLPAPRAGTDAYVKLHEDVQPFAHLWAQRAFVEQLVRATPDFRKALEGASSEEAALHKLMSDGAWMERFKAGKTRLEAGFIAMAPASGEVKAWVGSRDFATDQYDHVAQAARQPGSTFKPVVYAAALERGLAPERTYFDRPLEVALHDGTVWKPSDMSGASLLGVSMRDGLVYSKNSVTVQVMQDVGLFNVVDLARAMGINRSRLDPVPSLALGTSAVTLLEMTSAYATLARQGEYREPVVISRITDRDGRVIAQFGSEPPKRVMSEDTAVEVVDMMRGVVSQGTGAQIRTRFGVKADVAGKTGTTQNNTDGWFVLMHPDLVAGAWVGFNDARITMRSDHWGQGGHNAVLLVGDFFRSALQERLIDAAAAFPESRRPPVPLVAPWPSDTWRRGADGWVRSEPPDTPREPGTDAAVSGAPAEAADAAAADAGPAEGLPAAHASSPAASDVPMSPEEIERVMVGLGLDPLTGEPRASAAHAEGVSSVLAAEADMPASRSVRSTRAPPALSPGSSVRPR
jgi:penicillin-binding protein 1A